MMKWISKYSQMTSWVIIIRSRYTWYLKRVWKNLVPQVPEAVHNTQHLRTAESCQPLAQFRISHSCMERDTEIFHWQFFRPHYGPGVDSASIRNEYQEYFLG